ncbi:MAG: helix-turn-helix domain-containing protein [Proteobacteria bacterium]|nr:helix-turn-helix domain-containing protein [Pseudomonadota bacterium]
MESFSERLKVLRGDLTQATFAQKFDIHRNTISRYESGDGAPDGEFLKTLCRYYNLNSEWLLFGEGPMYKDQKTTNRQAQEDSEGPQSLYVDENGETVIPRWKNPDPEMFDYIPMAETKLSAGGGSFVLSEDVEGYYAFRKSWLSAVTTNPNKLVLMRITGDSMSPTIQANDTVLIDIGRRHIIEGLIYAIRFDSTVMIKRLAFRPGGRILVISDNRTEYDAYEADMSDLHVLGQVIFFSRVFVPE